MRVEICLGVFLFRLVNCNRNLQSRLILLLVPLTFLQLSWIKHNHSLMHTFDAFVKLNMDEKPIGSSSRLTLWTVFNYNEKFFAKIRSDLLRERYRNDWARNFCFWWFQYLIYQWFQLEINKLFLKLSLKLS